jgi:hypothetical protein
VPTRSLQAAASSSSAAAEPPAVLALEAPFPASLGLSLIQFHRNVGPILKGSKAKYGKYANLHALLAAVTPHLCEQGLVLSQIIEDAAPAQVLVTTLTHVVSGEQLRSAVQIPTLDALLERAHAVRLQALRAWPLDFGRVPAPPSFALPPRNGNGGPPVAEPVAATQSAVIAPPARAAGEVALPDQLETLKATLVALGGNANPLHSLGGLITYLRRYQLLAILSLAAEDDDDDGDGWGADGPARSGARGPQARGSHAPEAGPRGPRPQPSASRPAATPAPRPRPPHPPAPAPAPAAASPATATPEPAEQEPATPEPAVREPAAPNASDPAVVQALGPELSQEQVKAVVHRMVALPQAVLPQVLNEFRATFGLPQDVRLSDYIRNQAHAAFLEERIAAHSAPALTP